MRHPPARGVPGSGQRTVRTGADLCPEGVGRKPPRGDSSGVGTRHGTPGTKNRYLCAAKARRPQGRQAGTRTNNKTYGNKNQLERTRLHAGGERDVGADGPGG